MKMDYGTPFRLVGHPGLFTARAEGGKMVVEQGGKDFCTCTKSELYSELKALNLLEQAILQVIGKSVFRTLIAEPSFKEFVALGTDYIEVRMDSVPMGFNPEMLEDGLYRLHA